MSGTKFESSSTPMNFAGWQVLPVDEPRKRRVGQLLLGLFVLGIGVTLSVKPYLGTGPWGVFGQGLANHTPLSFGVGIVVTGLVLIFLFRFIGQPLGLGTVLNAALVGIFVDIFMAMTPTPESMPVRLVMLALAPVFIGWGSGLYIGAGLGPGPRDGLMTTLIRMGLSARTSRTIIEISALTVGWIMGGDASWGTLWIALSIPQFVGFFLPKYMISKD